MWKIINITTFIKENNIIKNVTCYNKNNNNNIIQIKTI